MGMSVTWSSSANALVSKWPRRWFGKSPINSAWLSTTYIPRRFSTGTSSLAICSSTGRRTSSSATLGSAGVSARRASGLRLMWALPIKWHLKYLKASIRTANLIFGQWAAWFRNLLIYPLLSKPNHRQHSALKSRRVHLIDSPPASQKISWNLSVPC